MHKQTQNPAKIELTFRGIRDPSKQMPLNSFFANKLRSIQTQLVFPITLLGKYYTVTHYSLTKGGSVLHPIPNFREGESLSPGVLDKEVSRELDLSKIQNGSNQEKFTARLRALRLSKAAYSFSEALQQFGTETECRAFLNWFSKAENSGLFNLTKVWDSPEQLTKAYESQLETLEQIPALKDLWEEVRFSLPELPGLSFLPKPPEEY